MNHVSKTGLRPVPWTASDVVLGIVVVVVGFVVTLMLVAMAQPEVALAVVLVGGVGAVIILAAVWIIGLIRYGRPLADLGLKLPDSVTPLYLFGLPLLTVGGSLLFAVLYTTLLSQVGLDKILPPDVTEEIVLGGYAVVATVGVVVLLGPLAEEVFFRGFVFAGLIQRLGVSRALVGSSLVFALFHVDPRVMIPIFVTGLLLAWLYHKTGSLWGPFVGHAAQNAVALSASLWT